MAFDLFYPIRMAGFGVSVLIFAPIWRDKLQREKIINKAIHIDCPQSGQISCSRREHIEFPARETYRLKDWARTATRFTLHFLRAFSPGGAAALSPQVRLIFRKAKNDVWPERRRPPGREKGDRMRESLIRHFEPLTEEERALLAMPPDAATPKVSPLWWAELEIISTEAT